MNTTSFQNLFIRRATHTMLMLSGLLLMFSCTPSNTKKRGQYFAMDSLIDSQMLTLSALKASISKTIELNDTTTTVASYVPDDTTAWEKELALLREIQVINRPTSIGLYTVDVALSDPRSNLKVDMFTATKNLPVKSLRIYYHEQRKNLRKVEAVLSDDNALYKSEKSMIMEFDRVDEQVVLTGYSVIGTQKMYLTDTVRYRIDAGITLVN